MLNENSREVAAATAMRLPVVLSCASATLAQVQTAGHVLSLDVAMDAANEPIKVAIRTKYARGRLWRKSRIGLRSNLEPRMQTTDR